MENSKLIMDCHVHSVFSSDGKDTIENMCLSAVKKGIRHICITDHYEPEDTLLEPLDYSAFSDAVERARDRFSGELEVLKGIEFGKPHRYPGEFESMLKNDFDMVLCSIHSIPAEFPVWLFWYMSPDEYVRKNGKDFLKIYFDEIKKMTAFGGFDVVAHMDWPRYRFSVDEMMEECVDEIMENILKNGLVPEINTVGIRELGDYPHPAPAFLECYEKHGGKYVTVGSDSHQVKDVAADYDKIPGIMASSGLTAGFFRKREFVPVCSVAEKL